MVFSSNLDIYDIHKAGYTQPSGFPNPEILATFLAGPLGNRVNKSLVVAPDPVVIWRRVGALPEVAAL
jgi:hypothetical protein